MIKTQLEISIVHTINNWHASCTRNFKNPLASIYSSFTKIPEQVTNFKQPISPIKFWSRKANSKRLLSQYTLPTQKLNEEHATFGQYVFKQYKSIDKGNKKIIKRSQKASLQLSSSTDWQLQSMTGAHSKIAFILDKSSIRHYIV